MPATISQVALAWVIQNYGDIVVAIPGASKPHHAEEAASLRTLNVFAGLNHDDAMRVATYLVHAVNGFDSDDPLYRYASGLRQKAANVACGSDIQQWHDRGAVSNAFGIAADALAESCAKRSA